MRWAQPKTIRLVTLFGLLVISTLIIFHNLTVPSILGDEAIYSLASREAVARNSLFPLYMPHGMPYLDKPPAKIVLVALMFRAFGESPFVARCPDAIFGVLLIGLVFWWTSGRFGLFAGLVASMLLLGSTNLLTNHGIRESVMDALVMLIAFFITTVWIGYREEGKPSRTRWCAVFLGLFSASMTKPFFGVIFAIVLVFIELIGWFFKRFRPPRIGAALRLLLYMIIADLLYFLLMTAEVGDLYLERMTQQTVTRASRGIDPGHFHRFAFYGLDILGQFGWWLLFLVPGVAFLWSRSHKEAAGSVWVLSLWGAIIVAGFSISVSKLSWYVYPAYPAIVVVIGVGASVVLDRLPRRSIRALFLAGTVAALGYGVWGAWVAVENDKMILDVDKFVKAYEKLDSKALAVDADSIKADGGMRAWTRFYLQGATNSSWFRKVPVSFPEPGPKCRFVATSRPEDYRATPTTPWHIVGSFRNIDHQAGGIWIVGTCDLKPLHLDGMPEALEKAQPRPNRPSGHLSGVVWRLRQLLSKKPPGFRRGRHKHRGRY